MKRVIAIVLQVLLFSAIALLGDFLVKLAHVKLSGSIVGMILLFFLLKSGLLKLQWFDAGADWLHSRLVLFFVPSAVGISQYGTLLKSDGLFLLLTITASTVVVMVVTGLSAQFLNRPERVPVPILAELPLETVVEEEELHG